MVNLNNQSIIIGNEAPVTQSLLGRTRHEDQFGKKHILDSFFSLAQLYS